MKNKGTIRDKVKRMALFVFLIGILGCFVPQTVYSDEGVESVKVTESIADNYMGDVADMLKGFKNYNWQAALGGAVLMVDGDMKVEACTQLLKSKKEYVSLNFVYPEIIGVGPTLNLKKIGGDIWFKYCVKLDDEARTKLENKFKYLQYFRIDAGGFIGADSSDGEFKWGALFKVVEWNF